MKNQLKKLIAEVTALTKENNIFLSNQQQKLLKECQSNFIDDKVAMKKLEQIKATILGKLASNNKQQHTDIKYFDNLSFIDLMPNLYKITNNKQNEIYLYYNPKHITNYEQLSELEAKRFTQLAEAAAFCGPVGQNGIKYLKQSAPKCIVNCLDNKAIKTEFTHELKVLGTEARILCYTLNPLINGSGPTIIVACHFLSAGLHDTKDKRKTYNSDFISRFGMFRQSNNSQILHTELTAKVQNMAIRSCLKVV